MLRYLREVLDVATLHVYGLLQKRALITRESAGAIREALVQALGDDEVTLDFMGVDAVTPSFVDEVLAIAEEVVARGRKGSFRLLFLNPPSRLSSKFAAVGRARDLEFAETPDGAWVISGTTATVG